MNNQAVEDFKARYWRDNMQMEGTRGRLEWLGFKAIKCPMDLLVYQEILYERRPEWIIETGTNFGGSALFLASICSLIGVVASYPATCCRAGRIATSCGGASVWSRSWA